MRKKKIKQACIFLCLAMVVCLVSTKVDLTKKTKVSDSKTKLKSFTVGDSQLEKIADAAVKSGSKAADMVNELKGNDFEAAVNKVLTTYYKEDKNNCLGEFEADVNQNADDIIEGYKEAAKERAKSKQLSYESGVSLISFGADISEKEIKDVVKDQYGKCEYIHKSPDGTYMVKVKNSLGLTVDKAVTAYGKYSQTSCVAVNDKVEQVVEASELVNDTFAADQYYLNNMKAVDAWQYVRSVNHSKVKVAVIDGGADLNCSDLLNSSSLSAEILSDGSIISLSQSSQQYINMHGTNVAGVIGATANNGKQIAGVASCINNDVVDLINVKIEMYVDKIALGLDYALQCNAKVVNLSLAHSGSNDVEKAAVDRFVASGGTVVCGAGNDGSDGECYPSDYSNTISVVSVDSGYNIASSSNRGWNKDVCAPGVGIYAPGSGDTTYVTNGTSLASPMVAGIVAMMYSVNSGLNSTTTRNIIINTTTDLGDAGRDYTYAYGFVNAYKAVVAAGGGSVVETTTVAETESKTETETMPGYTTAGANWTELNNWSVYFASGWANDPTGSYKDGGSYNDFGVYVGKYSGTEWGIQMKTKTLSTNVGTTYVCKVAAQFNMNMTDTIKFKDEGTQVTKEYTLTSGTNNFEIEFTPTQNNTQLFFDLGKLPKGSNFVVTSFSLEEKEQPTQETETTATGIEGGIQINGYQVSATAGGIRTVYSVDSKIGGKTVTSSGIIYSLSDYAEASELYAGNTNKYVYKCQSTSTGLLSTNYSDSDIATSYAMTMLFATKGPLEYTVKWRIRAYAQLSDGTYVYTQPVEYTIYDVANNLYQNSLMRTVDYHNYLYLNILSIVDNNYKQVQYNYSNSIAKS